MIKAILFDVDGVLVDSKETVFKFRKKLFKKAGHQDIDEEHLVNGFHLPLKAVVDNALRSKGVKDQKEIERVYNLSFDPAIREGQDFKFPKRLEAILEELHREFKLGIITSRIRFGLDEIFKIRPIEKYFDVVISLDDVKNHKPHPEPLQKALDRLGLKAEESVYIGDSDTDIIAAHAIGMPSIHLGEIRHELAHHQIKSFPEIPNAIKLILDNHAKNNPL
ncbi:MAG TPA: HAD family hydrolase [Candidatus Saccharimonadales bacterium]|nr:HAD family hydrolase [Candidatus Saccharimonadales bacterium]